MRKRAWDGLKILKRQLTIKFIKRQHSLYGICLNKKSAQTLDGEGGFKL